MSGFPVLSEILSQMPYLLNGLWVAVQLLVVLLALGLVLGLGLALTQIYAHWSMRLAATAFERVFRGIPAIVLLLLFFYGVGNVVDISSFAAAALALGLRSAAYQSQIIRGAIRSVAPGQVTAAKAMGMSQARTIAWIVLPQALRYALGPWTNEFSSELKATSLAYVIGLVELTRQGKYIVSNLQGDTLIVFGVVAAMYFVVNYLGNHMIYRLERFLSVPGFERRGTR